MPSPFLGMDPYLEAPGWWPTVHHFAIGKICDALNAALPADYVASIEERNFIELTDDTVYPDVGIHRVSEDRPVYGGGTFASDGSIVVAAREENVRERFMRIVHVSDQSHSVVEIELLSPINKDTRGRGREK